MEQDRLVLYAALALAFAVGVFVFWGPSNLKRKRGKGHVGGLLNLGHSCFLNTLLQAFGSCPHIMRWLGQQQTEAGGVIGALRFTLQVINGDHPEIRDDPFAPCDILSSLRARWNISPGEQDAHELFVVLVSALEDESQRAVLPRACSLSDALELPTLLAPRSRLNSGTVSQNSGTTSRNAGASHNSGAAVENACAGVNSDTECQDSGTASENSEFASMNSDTASQNADNASHSACASQNSDAVSPNACESQNSGIASQNSDAVSSNACESQNSGIMSQNSGIASQNSGIESQSSGIASQNSGIASQNSGTASRNSGAASRNGRPTFVREVQSEWSNAPSPPPKREMRSPERLLRTGVYRAATNRTHASLVRNPSLAGLPRESASPFQGLLTSSLQCTECEFKNVVQCDKFDSLSLPLPSGSLGRLSLSDLLDHFIATETVCVRCDSCKRPQVDFLKTLNFAKLPGCLCIHIVRTTWLSDGRASKRTDQVDYPELLLMDKYTYTQKEGDAKGRRHCYQLKSVIVHRGDLNSGHFVTYRRSKHSWVLTSDAEVLECTYAEAMSASAYMLFYDKC